MDVATGQELRALGGNGETAISVAYSPDGKLLASGSGNNAKLWQAASGDELRTFTGHTDTVESVAFSPDSKLLATGSADYAIKLWDVATGRELRTMVEKGTGQGPP